MFCVIHRYDYQRNTVCFFFSSRRRHTRCALVTGVQTCALPISSSIGISFEQLAKNFSDANYSAARAALLDVWQGIMRLRFWFGQHVLSLIYGAVIEEAWEIGRAHV